MIIGRSLFFMTATTGIVIVATAVYHCGWHLFIATIIIIAIISWYLRPAGR